MTNIKTKTQIVDEETGLMIRVDKTLKEMIEEKPSSRWDVNYWHTDIDNIISFFLQKYGPKKVKRISDYMAGVYQGDTYRTKKGDRYLSSGGNIIINVVNLLNTGIDWPTCKRITDSHYNRVKRAEPRRGNLLFIRLGAGSIGRTLVFTGIPGENKIGITGHINNVILKNVNPCYVDIYLKTYFGQRQIKRFESGTSNQTEFRQEDFSSIFIPEIEKKIQNNIEIEYLKISTYHNKAMEEKKKGNEKKYKVNLEIAEKLLSDLIKKTEQVIRGEKKGVI